MCIKIPLLRMIHTPLFSIMYYSCSEPSALPGSIIAVKFPLHTGTAYHHRKFETFPILLNWIHFHNGPNKGYYESADLSRKTRPLRWVFRIFGYSVHIFAMSTHRSPRISAVCQCPQAKTVAHLTGWSPWIRGVSHFPPDKIGPSTKPRRGRLCCVKNWEHIWKPDG